MKTKTNTDGVTSQSKESAASRLEQKASSTSDKASPSRSNSDSKSSIERTKNRILLHKEEKAKSLSPPLSAECEYDFDQHLLKEKLSEKKKFLSSIHLTPRIPSTESASVQSPKMPKIEQKPDTPQSTNSSKDIKSVTNSTPPTKTPATTAQEPIVKNYAKKPENKASKRKSREPVKNVAKVKCLMAVHEGSVDVHMELPKPTIVPKSNSSITSSSPPQSSSSSVATTSTQADQLKETMKMLNAFSQQNKNNLQSLANKSIHAAASSTKNLFKAPSNSSGRDMASSSSSASSSTSASSSHKSQTPTSDTETSIIINNVQRPNQADTPRPSMSFKPNLNQQQPFSNYFSPNRNFPTETEIQGIPNDDASKLKVYGPAMSLGKPPFDIPGLGSILPGGELMAQQIQSAILNRYGKQPALNFNTLANYPLSPSNIAALLHQQNNLQPHLQAEMFQKNNKSKKQATLDMKKLSNIIGDTAESIGGSYNQKLNSFQKSLLQLRTNPEANESPKHCLKQQKVQTLLNSCKIPPSLSITLTNDETESLSRSIFNNKNSNVVNSIEILKLPDESSNEPNARYPTATSSPSNIMQTIEKETTRSTTSPGSLNLVNQAAAAASQVAEQLSTQSYQQKFLLSLLEKNDTKAMENLNKPNKKQKPIKLNRPLTPSQQTPPPPQHSFLSGLSIFDELNREAQKRKQESLDAKSAEKAMKARKLQRPIYQQTKGDSLTQRPLPGLVVVKEPKALSPSLSSQPSTSSGALNTSNNLLSSQTNNVGKKKDRQSPTVSTSSSISLNDTVAAIESIKQNVINTKMQQQAANMQKELAASKNNYLPLQTSAMPIWTNHFTESQMASHKQLVENLSQNKKNTFVE